MATNELNTRIILKNDDTATWTSNAPTLKRGEVGIVFGRPTVQSGTQTTMLVGNGTSNLDLYAKASDVYNWAKASTKPTYSTSEISGMSDYVTTDSLTTTLADYVTGTTLTQEISTSITTNNNKAPTYVNLSSYCTNDFVVNATNATAALLLKNGFVTIIGNRRCPAKDNTWTANNFYTLINIPAAYKPSHTIPFAVSSFTNNVIIGGRLTTGGELQVRIPSVANFICAFSFTYPI